MRPRTAIALHLQGHNLLGGSDTCNHVAGCVCVCMCVAVRQHCTVPSACSSDGVESPHSIIIIIIISHGSRPSKKPMLHPHKWQAGLHACKHKCVHCMQCSGSCFVFADLCDCVHRNTFSSPVALLASLP